MNTDTEFSPGRETAIRALLVEAATPNSTLAAQHHNPNPQASGRAHPWASATRRRLLLGATALTGLSVAGGVVAAATGILVLPGDTATTNQTPPVVATGSGPVNLDLGPVPEDATHVMFELTCLSSGYFAYEGSNILSCVDPLGGVTATSYWPIEDGDTTLQIETTDTMQWELVATYVLRETTAWATNTKGETYGVPNENGFPDLTAANTTDDGTQGYVYVKELYGPDGPQPAPSDDDDEANKFVTVPMYDQNGETVLGEYTITIK